MRIKFIRILRLKIAQVYEDLKNYVSLKLHQDKRIFGILAIVLHSDILCIIDTKYKSLLGFVRCIKTSTKIVMYSINFCCIFVLLVLKNNLRIILGSKSEKFRNIEVLQKVRHSYKKDCRNVGKNTN